MQPKLWEPNTNHNFYNPNNSHPRQSLEQWVKHTRCQVLLPASASAAAAQHQVHKISPTRRWEAGKVGGTQNGVLTPEQCTTASIIAIGNATAGGPHLAHQHPPRRKKGTEQKDALLHSTSRHSLTCLCIPLIKYLQAYTLAYMAELAWPAPKQVGSCGFYEIVHGHNVDW